VPLADLQRHRNQAGGAWRLRPTLHSASRAVVELGAARGLLRSGAQGALTEYADAGAGAPVLLIPGFLVGDRSLDTLARHLAAAGHRPCPAGMKRNLDCSEAVTARLSDRLRRLAIDHGGRVAIVGHSRGGMLAQVLARRHPDAVSAVVTIATPQREPLALNPALLASALSLGVAGSLGLRGVVRCSCAFGDCCRTFRADLATSLGPEIPYLAVYSRRDGIVDWRACLDPDGRHVEVSASHCAMASDRVTLHLVAEFLERAARWQVDGLPALAA
jgi:pimeloyl-ACP methyl ester carboxylesterase